MKFLLCRSCRLPLVPGEKIVCHKCAFESEGRPRGPYRKHDDEQRARFKLYGRQGLTLVSGPAQLSPARARTTTKEVDNAA